MTALNSCFSKAGLVPTTPAVVVKEHFDRVVGHLRKNLDEMCSEGK